MEASYFSEFPCHEYPDKEREKCSPLRLIF